MSFATYHFRILYITKYFDFFPQSLCFFVEDLLNRIITLKGTRAISINFRGEACIKNYLLYVFGT